MSTRASYIHETAVVDADVQIGPGSKVWHFCHLLEHTQIGENCVLGQNCAVGPNVRIGNGVRVQNNVSIYHGVEIEDDVFLGPSMVFTNVINPRAFISRKDAFRSTLVRQGATIGANATVVCGVTIGRYALVGAGAVVAKDVPDFALVVGVPGRVVGYVSRAARRLHFDEQGQAECPEDGSHYRRVAGRVKEVQ
ncbi:MAG: N-acetyltransferase [Deltaproteobacteria bacterium]|nr:N-acetyltransferase [Deltaproteobacteria bacterium]